jgi:hypothetical protein
VTGGLITSSIAGSLVPAGFGGGERESGEVGPTQVISTSPPLLRRQGEIWIHLGLELGQEGSTSLGGRHLSVVTRVH